MGLFSKVKDAQAQAQAAMQGAQGSAGMGMGGGNMQAQAAGAQLAQKLYQSGVEAPGVIHAIRPSGQKQFGGGQQVEFDVSIKPASGDPYQTTISQSMLPAQLEDLSEGKSITVRYDADAPAMALIYGW